MAPIVSSSAPASSSKQKAKSRRSKNSAKKNLIAAQPSHATADTAEDLIPLDDVVMSGVVVEESTNAGAEMEVDPAAPSFPALPASAQRTTEKSETRRIPIPPHRMTPLKKDWVNIFSPLTEMLGLQVRMNVQKRAVEIRTSKHTKDVGAIQKGADFAKAYALGFDVNDAIALLRLDDLYLDSFEVKDVKTLHGDHLSRAIGRIAGHDGKTKFTIENASRTRIVLADTQVHLSRRQYPN
ncbi:pre-rRNA-processing protein pno1 [Ceratobasidium sp. 428]|nr:pre-rRNA-processing protein pno1 [Ceratobasidium sp. 428]